MVSDRHLALVHDNQTAEAIGDDRESAEAGSDAASSPKARTLISPMVLSLIMASCIVTKAPIS